MIILDIIRVQRQTFCVADAENVCNVKGEFFVYLLSFSWLLLNFSSELWTLSYPSTYSQVLTILSMGLVTSTTCVYIAMLTSYVCRIYFPYGVVLRSATYCSSSLLFYFFQCRTPALWWKHKRKLTEFYREGLLLMKI